MAMNYREWEAATQPVKEAKVLEAKDRLEDDLRQDPNSMTDLPRFFQDTYLLAETNYFDYENPDLLKRVQARASAPPVFKGFLDNVKAQDIAAESAEVLASLKVATRLDYDKTPGVGSVLATLYTRHTELLAAAERQAAQEAQRQQQEQARQQREAERERRRQEAEEKRKAETTWFAREPLVGKSPEWADAVTYTERLWHAKTTGLPKGPARNSRTADMQYLVAGFNLLHEEILRGGMDSLRLRAMVEYLIPEIWRQPILVTEDLKEMEKVLNNKRKPYEQAAREHEEAVRQAKANGTPEPPDPGSWTPSLKDLTPVQKMLLVPARLRDQNVKANPDQKKEITSIFRAFNKAVHQDIKKDHPDIDQRLLPFVGKLHTSVNVAWNKGKEF